MFFGEKKNNYVEHSHLKINILLSIII